MKKLHRENRLFCYLIEEENSFEMTRQTIRLSLASVPKAINIYEKNQVASRVVNNKIKASKKLSRDERCFMSQAVGDCGVTDLERIKLGDQCPLDKSRSTGVVEKVVAEIKLVRC